MAAYTNYEYMMKTYAEAQTYGGKLESDIKVPVGILTVGVDGYLRNWDAVNTLPIGTQKMMPDVDSRNIGAFLQYDRPIGEDFRLTLGTRFDHNEMKAHDDRTDLYAVYHGTGDREAADSYVGGNVQLLYTPVKMVELFAGFGHVTRPPAPDERYLALRKPMMNPDWVGNPELSPVMNREFDVGIKYLGDLFYGKTTFFYSDVKDYIDIYNVDGPVKSAKSYRNVDATLYGGEMNLNLFFPFDVHLQGGLSYTWAKDESYDKPLSEIPPLQGRVAARYDIETYFAEIEGVFADKQDRVDPDLNEEETDGWGIMNLKTGMKYRGFSIFAGVHNVFDEQYYEHLSYQRDPFRTGIRVPEIGRSFYVNLAYAW
jgi:iron complex outermembrane receptor protein